VVNTKIKEESRKRFTIAHECGHFLLPGQQDLSTPCSKEKDRKLERATLRPELDANRFAAEILMPGIQSVLTFRLEPTMDSIRSTPHYA